MRSTSPCYCLNARSKRQALPIILEVTRSIVIMSEDDPTYWRHMGNIFMQWRQNSYLNMSNYVLERLFWYTSTNLPFCLFIRKKEVIITAANVLAEIWSLARLAWSFKIWLIRQGPWNDRICYLAIDARDRVYTTIKTFCLNKILILNL